MLYWPYTSKEKLPELQATMKAREEAKMRLESQTVDLVSCGEQQPENDHNFKGEKTDTGIYKERHYRNGTGFFSYDLKNPKLEARKLRITYFGSDKSRNFEVYLNSVLVASIAMDGKEGNQFIVKIIEIPAEVLQSNAKLLEVKFQAKPNSSITGIYEVRLMK